MDNFDIQFGPSRYRVLSEGFYELVLKKISLDVSKFGDVYRLIFEVVATKIKGAWPSKFVGCEVHDMVARKDEGAAGKLLDIAEALTGKRFSPDQKVNSQELVGKKCHAYIIQKSDKRHNNKIAYYVSSDEYQKSHGR